MPYKNQRSRASRASKAAATRRYMATPEGRAKRDARRSARAKRHRAILDAYKLERGCADCGYKEAAVALDFDHVRGVKMLQIASLISFEYSMKRIMEEIAKCEVVCANCHRIRTWNRGQRYANNGH